MGGGPIGDGPAPDGGSCLGTPVRADAGTDPTELLVSFELPAGRECTCFSSFRRIAPRAAAPAGRGGTGGDCTGGVTFFVRGER